MSFISTEFPGLLIYEPRVFEDNRGYFYESYNERVFNASGIDIRFVQDNQARSEYGVIRGLHFQQEPFAQSKLVRALSGTILDVVVDIRNGSPTYGKSFSIELSAENKRQLFVPAGFAHGYSVISAEAEVFYKCDRFWNKEAEGGIQYNDAAFKIDWKIPEGKGIVSGKDMNYPAFGSVDYNFRYK